MCECVQWREGGSGKLSRDIEGDGDEVAEYNEVGENLQEAQLEGIIFIAARVRHKHQETSAIGELKDEGTQEADGHYHHHERQDLKTNKPPTNTPQMLAKWRVANW